MRIPKVLKRELNDIRQLWGSAQSDPEVATLVHQLNADIARAHHLQGQAQADLTAAILERLSGLAELIIRAEPRLAEVLGSEGIVAALRSGLLPGEPDPPLRIRGPAVHGVQIVHVLREQAGIQEFAATLLPGRIVVDATDLDEAGWRELWPFIGEQQRLEGLRTRAMLGRPPGSRSAVRAELVGQVREHPEWSNPEIYRAGVELGVWEPGTYAGDPRRNWARVNRIRQAARRR